MSKNHEEEEKDPSFPEKYAWKALVILALGAAAYWGSAYWFVIAPEL